jgi:hypothetical protein
MNECKVGAPNEFLEFVEFIECESKRIMSVNWRHLWAVVSDQWSEAENRLFKCYL